MTTITQIQITDSSGSVETVQLEVNGDEIQRVQLSTAPGLPTGGTTAQMLVKNSATNYDYGWADPDTSHDHDSDYDALGAATTAVSNHEAAGDPHPTYATDTALTSAVSNHAALATHLPSGGTTNQILAKQSASNYDADWQDAPSGGSAHIVQDEGSSVAQRTKLNFVGDTVAVTDDSGNDATVVTISGSSGSGHTIQDEGSDLTQRTNLNFVGSGVAATDDSGNDRTIITVNAAGSTYLDDMVDVNAPSPANGATLVWVDGSSEWQAGTVSGGSGTLATASVLIAASNAPASVKAMADVECDGTADQVEINSALSAGTYVQLSQGTFSLSDAIVLNTGSKILGSGFGTTILDVSSSWSSGTAVLRLSNTSVHSVEIGHFRIEGHYRGSNVNGIWFNNYGGSFSAAPDTSPDTCHFVHDLWIHEVSGHGYVNARTQTPSADTHTTWDDGRENRVTNVFVQHATLCGFFEAGSDNFYWGNTAASVDDKGFVLGSGSGNCHLTLCKAYYCDEEGFWFRGNRHEGTILEAQDNRMGFFIRSNASMFTQLSADSNGRLETGNGYGYYIAGKSNYVQGNAHDRNQSSDVQDYSVNFNTSAYTANDNVVIIHSTRDRANHGGVGTVGEFTGTPLSAGVVYGVLTSDVESPKFYLDGVLTSFGGGGGSVGTDPVFNTVTASNLYKSESDTGGGVSPSHYWPGTDIANGTAITTGTQGTGNTPWYTVYSNPTALNTDIEFSYTGSQEAVEWRPTASADMLWSCEIVCPATPSSRLPHVEILGSDGIKLSQSSLNTFSQVTLTDGSDGTVATGTVALQAGTRYILHGRWTKGSSTNTHRVYVYSADGQTLHDTVSSSAISPAGTSNQMGRIKFGVPWFGGSVTEVMGEFAVATGTPGATTEIIGTGSVVSKPVATQEYVDEVVTVSTNDASGTPSRDGLLWYNTSTAAHWVSSGSSWIAM